MTEIIYWELAKHLDKLPGGFPPTESGAEIRVLQHLFTPEEASLATYLTLLGETSRVVARRAGLSVAEVDDRLQEMARKGLIYCDYKEDGPDEYMAMPWVIGIYEAQVGRLTPELLRDIGAYHDEFGRPDFWSVGPQLRTIPVGESITVRQDVLIHEQAEELVKAREKYAVAPCICRQQAAMIGLGCDKPLETCLIFDGFAEYYVRNGLGREIDQTEALDIIRSADKNGLVLQPGNARAAMNICCCCGDCCGVLQIAKRHPQPATVLSSPYVAQVDLELCNDCYTCTTRCQMEALEMGDEGLILYEHRCIGCGLCVTTCTTGALSLARKPDAEQPSVPKDFAEMHIQRGRARGVLGTGDLVGLVVRSKIDRILAQ
jgi:Fe-S-cluster-containing hydrogenase component 2